MHHLFRFPLVIVGVLICLVMNQPSFGQENLPAFDEFEKRAANIDAKLQEIDPASLNRHNRTGYDLVKQLENIGPEARCAIPVLKSYASQDNLVGYRLSALKSSVRTLANMGDEAILVLKDLLKNSDGKTLYWTLSELNKTTYFDYSPLFPELTAIANRDRHSPSAEIIAREKAAFKNANPDVDLNSGFSMTSGSQTLDEFREVEIRARIAIDIILSCRETREIAANFLVDRVTRKENPSFEGLDRLVGNAEVISALEQIALTADESHSQIQAAHSLSQFDTGGETSIPVVLSLLASTGSDSDQLLSQEAVKLLRNHPAMKDYDRAKINTAIEAAPQSEQSKLRQELLEEPKRKIERLLSRFQELKKSDERAAHEVASKIIRLQPNNQSVIDFLMEIVRNESAPSQIQTSLGFGRPGLHNLRPRAARDLAFVGVENRQRVLVALRKYMNEYVGSGARTPTDLATSAAWSVAQLDRSDRSCLRFIAEIPVPFSNSYIARPFYGQSGAYVAQVLGDRIDLAAKRLTIQSLNYDSTGRNASFAREILLNAQSKEPIIRMLVQHAFQKIKGEAQQRRVSILTGRGIAISFLLDYADRLRPAFDTICSQCTSPNYEARKIAIRLLGEIQHDPEKSIAILAHACSDERAMVRCLAAQALGKFERNADVALAQLRALTSDPYQSVRNAAHRAIK